MLQGGHLGAPNYVKLHLMLPTNHTLSPCRVPARLSPQHGKLTFPSFGELLVNIKAHLHWTFYIEYSSSSSFRISKTSCNWYSCLRSSQCGGSEGPNSSHIPAWVIVLKGQWHSKTQSPVRSKMKIWNRPSLWVNYYRQWENYWHFRDIFLTAQVCSSISIYRDDMFCIQFRAFLWTLLNKQTNK